MVRAGAAPGADGTSPVSAPPAADDGFLGSRPVAMTARIGTGPADGCLIGSGTGARIRDRDEGPARDRAGGARVPGRARIAARPRIAGGTRRAGRAGRTGGTGDARCSTARSGRRWVKVAAVKCARAPAGPAGGPPGRTTGQRTLPSRA